MTTTRSREWVALYCPCCDVACDEALRNVTWNVEEERIVSIDNPLSDTVCAACAEAIAEALVTR